MGYVFCTGICIGCGRIFSFNPLRVPSTRRTPESELEPVCRNCIELWNPIRVQKGLAPIDILPDAYDAIDEQELP